MKGFCKSLVCAVLAGCGGAAGTALTASPPLAAAAPTDARPAASQSFVFTCQNGTVFDCLVYDQHGKLRRKLTTSVESPLGVAAGKDGLLYVANSFGSNILVYSSAGRRLLRELGNAGNVPIDVAVFNDALAVSNEHVLTYFRAHATKPTRTLHELNVLQGDGVAFDPHGNCYWSFSTSSATSQLDEFVGCKGKPRVVPITTSPPFGLAFDSGGNLWYTSFSSSKPGIYACVGTSECQLLDANFIDPEYLSFSGDSKYFFVNDPGNISAGSAIYKVNAANRMVVEKITAGLTFYNPPSGVAADPGPF